MILKFSLVTNQMIFISKILGYILSINYWLDYISDGFSEL